MDGAEIDVIISMMQKRPALWRKKDHNYMNRDVRKKLIDQISAATGYSAAVCNRKIKSLKDRMRICVAKLPKTKSGAPAYEKAGESVSWPHFEKMLFMKEQFAPRGTTGNAHSEEEEDDAFENTDSMSSVSVHFEQGGATPESLHPARAVKREANHIDFHEYLDIERQRIEQIISSLLNSDQRRKDDVYYFMEDIANDLRNIRDPVLKLQTKSKVRRVVEEAIYTQLNLDKGLLTASQIPDAEQCSDNKSHA